MHRLFVCWKKTKKKIKINLAQLFLACLLALLANQLCFYLANSITNLVINLIISLTIGNAISIANTLLLACQNNLYKIS